MQKEEIKSGKADTQQVDVPKAEAQKIEAQKIEAQKIEAQKIEAQKIEAQPAWQYPLLTDYKPSYLPSYVSETTQQPVVMIPKAVAEAAVQLLQSAGIQLDPEVAITPATVSTLLSSTKTGLRLLDDLAQVMTSTTPALKPELSAELKPASISGSVMSNQVITQEKIFSYQPLSVEVKAKLDSDITVWLRDWALREPVERPKFSNVASVVQGDQILSGFISATPVSHTPSLAMRQYVHHLVQRYVEQMWIKTPGASENSQVITFTLKGRNLVDTQVKIISDGPVLEVKIQVANEGLYNQMMQNKGGLLETIKTGTKAKVVSVDIEESSSAESFNEEWAPEDVPI